MKIALFAVAACAAAALSAQAVAVTQAGAVPQIEAIQNGQPTMATLRAGTSVPLRTLVELTTEKKKLKVGQRFELEVAEAVTVDGQTVIPVGSPAVGEVTSVRNKGMWGKSGAIEARVLYVRAHGRQIRLSGSLDDKGTTGTAGVVGAAVLLPVAGFFLTGTSAKIAAGSNVRGFVEEDVPVSFARVGSSTDGDRACSRGTNVRSSRSSCRANPSCGSHCAVS
jgi:hypothetical protein